MHTPYHLETYLSNSLGFEVHIADCHDPGEYGFKYTHPNRFEAVFIGEGTLDTKKVRTLLDRLKQSHTVYTINDRIIIILDNRNIGLFFFQNIRLHFQMFFWGCPVFDGAWDFDGTLDFNARRRYDLVPGIKYRGVGIATDEQIYLQNIDIKTYIKGVISNLWASAVRIVVNYWHMVFLTDPKSLTVTGI